MNENDEPALSHAMQVSNYSEGTSEEDLKLFFQERKRSGGDTVEAVYKIDGGRKAVVVFTKDEGTVLIFIQ